MAKEVVTRCDKCGKPDGVREFKITVDGRAKEVDLCPAHGAPILEAFELGVDLAALPTVTLPSSPAGGGRPLKHSVVAVEDWTPPGGLLPLDEPQNA